MEIGVRWSSSPTMFGARALLALALCLAFASPLAAWRLPAPRMMAAGDDAKAFCQALQDGESPDGLAEFLLARAGARAFFDSYLRDEAWTCADGEVPSGLVDSLELVPPESVEVVLMNVCTSSAASTKTSERERERARILVAGTRDRVPHLQRSCVAFGEAVAAELGEKVTEYDAAGGDVELLRIQWSGLLGVCNYDREQLEAVREALRLVSAE